MHRYQQYISMAAGSSVKNLNKEKVSALVVAYPDIKEQERIADALSNIDSLIATLEKQIAKKKAIKQGTMQELLTGKRRLPGFSGEWRYFNLMKNSKVKARIGWQGLKKSIGCSGIVSVLVAWLIERANERIQKTHDREIVELLLDGFDIRITAEMQRALSRCARENNVDLDKSYSVMEIRYLVKYRAAVDREKVDA